MFSFLYISHFLIKKRDFSWRVGAGRCGKEDEEEACVSV